MGSARSRATSGGLPSIYASTRSSRQAKVTAGVAEPFLQQYEERVKNEAGFADKVKDYQDYRNASKGNARGG